jgi:YHS domain-containing protein
MGLTGRITATVSMVMMIGAVGFLFSQSGTTSMDHSKMGGMKMDMASDTSKMAPDTGKKMLSPQTTCPVTGDPINKKLYVDYKGKRIYVCCESCIGRVKKNPEKYIKKLEAMGQSVETIPGSKTAHAKALVPQKTCPVMGNPIDRSIFVDYKGKRVYFCCSMCPETFRQDPEKYLKVLADRGEAVEEIGKK